MPRRSKKGGCLTADSVSPLHGCLLSFGTGGEQSLVPAVTCRHHGAGELFMRASVSVCVCAHYASAHACTCMHVSVSLCVRVCVRWCDWLQRIVLPALSHEFQMTVFLSSAQAFYRWRYNTLRRQPTCSPQSLLAALRNITRARAQVPLTLHVHGHDLLLVFPAP